MKRFEIPSGGVALLKPRTRNTVLARFAENNPDVIDEIMSIMGYSDSDGGETGLESVKVNPATVVLKGLKADDADVVMQFLSEHITGFEEVLDEAGNELDWKALNPEDRLLAVDLYLSRLDIVMMFMSAWAHYQGLGSRTVRVDDSKEGESEDKSKPTKKKRKRKTPGSVKEEAGR